MIRETIEGFRLMGQTIAEDTRSFIRYLCGQDKPFHVLGVLLAIAFFSTLLGAMR
jgi:hypothetical protein